MVFEVSIIEHVPYFHAIESYVKNFFIIKFRVLIALFYSFASYTSANSPSNIPLLPLGLRPRANNEMSRVNNPWYRMRNSRIKQLAHEI